MTYCIYHIPNKKIGVTNDLKNRVEKQQGYKEEEYEVLEMSEDIDYISKRELELQEEYGYKVDRQPYKDLYKPINNKNMNINVTEQTTTFPCPVNKLKGQLMDNMGMTWQTDHGEFMITKYSLDWIMDNVQTSMYNKKRCYVYNKAGEVGRAILKQDEAEVIDGIGDMVVVLTNLAELIGTPIEECIARAYDVIAKRTGKMVNGTFAKDE
jgi:hypothetical protein